MFRFYTFPKWLKVFYPKAIWDFFYVFKDKTIYLTFDDGPNEISTKWILNELDNVNAKATFFCVGQQVKNQPELFNTILDKKHRVGNHSMNHLNGFKTKTSNYLKDVELANTYIDSNLFRPPYGKLTPKQHKALIKLGYTTIFWSLITYDFDATLSASKRMDIILNKIKNGSIIVFHDSDKAFPQLKNELPIILNEIKQAGYKFEVIQ